MGQANGLSGKFAAVAATARSGGKFPQNHDDSTSDLFLLQGAKLK
jgi:hypothetical protein